MMKVCAFICRLTVFLVLSLCSTLASREYELTLYGRVLVSTLQVLIFCGMAAIYEVCMWIMRGMSHVDIYRSVEEKAEQTESPEDTIAEEAVEVDTPEEEVAEPTGQIVFASTRDLQRHIWSVYYLGVLMYCTIFCLDYTLLSTTFFFSVGMLAGWVVYSLTRCKETTMSHCLRLVYFMLLSLLVMFYLVSHKKMLDPDTQLASRDALIAIVIPMMAGAGWMHISHKKLTSTLNMSFFTCCLLCLPLLMVRYRVC